MAKRTQFWLTCSCLESRPPGNSPTLRYKDSKLILNTWSRVQKHFSSLFQEHFTVHIFFYLLLLPPPHTHTLGTSSFILVVRIILDSINPALLLEVAQELFKLCQGSLGLSLHCLLLPSALLLFKSGHHLYRKFSLLLFSIKWIVRMAKEANSVSAPVTV